MNLMDYPIFISAFCLLAFWLSAHAGALLRKRRIKLDEAEHEDLTVILGATLTLLGLIIGFSFSMATSRYDQRKNYEEAEANAIGTEYVRAALLAPADAARSRTLLKSYLDQRILFYTTRNAGTLAQINTSTAQLQDDLWSTVAASGVRNPTPVTALVLSGMNDVLNSQGYTQSAWWNRIPIAAWALLIAIGISCNILFGYNARKSVSAGRRFLLLPLIISVSFGLIADLDSPNGGVIHVRPQNLISLSTLMK
jgi:hypothetical protein